MLYASFKNSAEDWEKEAAQMGNVYNTAYLTIAATSAASSSDGFWQRSTWPWPVVQMPSSLGEITAAESSKGCFIRYQPGYSDYSRQDAIDKSVWNTRGWTYQERLLSNRILHFVQGKLYWECRNAEGSEENEPTREAAYYTQWMSTDVGTKTSVLLPSGDIEVDDKYGS